MIWEAILAKIGIKIGTEIGIKAVEKFFDSSGKKSMVSVVLAVGYYYNFLDPVSGVIKSNQFSLYSSQTDTDKRDFKPKDINIKIIIPGRLDVKTFKKCEDELKSMSHHKGHIYVDQNKRKYGINYSLSGSQGNEILSIIDLARPIMSVKRFYEEILKLETHDDTNTKWQKVQGDEIKAFKDAIRKLQKSGYESLFDKLDFIEIA